MDTVGKFFVNKEEAKGNQFNDKYAITPVKYLEPC